MSKHQFDCGGGVFLFRDLGESVDVGSIVKCPDCGKPVKVRRHPIHVGRAQIPNHNRLKPSTRTTT